MHRVWGQPNVFCLEGGREGGREKEAGREVLFCGVWRPTPCDIYM